MSYPRPRTLITIGDVELRVSDVKIDTGQELSVNSGVFANQSILKRQYPTVSFKPDCCGSIKPFEFNRVVIHGPTRKRWVFPKSRFVEYGPEDEEVCRYCRIGYEGTFRETIVFEKAVIERMDNETVVFKGLPTMLSTEVTKDTP